MLHLESLVSGVRQPREPGVHTDSGVLWNAESGLRRIKQCGECHHLAVVLLW
jgi:hypothetical protein